MKKELLVMKHDAKKAGLHYDLRLEVKPNKFKSWRLNYKASKELSVPIYKNKITAIETTIHSKKEAEFTGTIKDGEYGAGTIKRYFKSEVEILKTDSFKSKITFKINNGKYKNDVWVLFKIHKDIWIFFKVMKKNIKNMESVTHTKKEFMYFPRNEYLDLKKRLNSDKPIYTTRINKEYGKYKDNQIVDSPFGELKVIEITKVDKLSDHPFLKQLTNYQRKVLKGHRMEVIMLKRVSKKKSLNNILCDINYLLKLVSS